MVRSRNVADIVLHNGKVIGHQAVTASNHKVAGFRFQSHALRALQAIRECNRVIVSSNPNGHVAGFTAVAARTRIDRAERAPSNPRQIATGAATPVGDAAGDQFRDACCVVLMKVRLVGDRAIPLEAVGFQCIEYEFVSARLFAGRIDILDAQQPLTVRRSSLQIAGNCGQQRAEMQWAGWRGREPADVCSVKRCRHDLFAGAPLLSEPSRTAWRCRSLELER